MAPSVSYSITVRLEVASHGRTVSEITRAVEHAGGVVTALDVTSGHQGKLRVDVTCAATDTAHAESLVAAMADVSGVSVHKVSDRTFLLHLGGRSRCGPRCRCATATTCPWPTRPAWHGYRWRWPPSPRTPAALRSSATASRWLPTAPRCSALATSALRRAAGHGGQVGALQAIRQHRRLADLPGHPGHRRDRPDCRRHRPRVRRHQPGRHLRAALLRSRAQAARHARHPRVPRRPARHRDRRARRAHQRAPRGRQGPVQRQDRHGRCGRGRHRRAEAAAQRRRH